MSELYPETLLNVVLVQPEIPNNTGNVGRTCVGLWSKLHLVGPLGFSIDDKQLKRAGLDYWQHLEFEYHRQWQDFESQVPDPSRIFILETGSENSLFDAQFRKGDYLVFGRETKGMPPEILEKYSKQVLTIPFPGHIRSFNLANTVAMAMCEAFRQIRQP